MPKSLYQYRIDPENKQQIETMLNQTLPSLKYKPTKEPNVFACGDGFLAAKRKIEYKIAGNILSICIWKIFNGRHGRTANHSANSTIGCALNSGMKKTIEKAANMISQQYPLTLVTGDKEVGDDFLAYISSSEPQTNSFRESNRTVANGNSCLKCGCAIGLTESEKLIKYGPVLKSCPKCGSLFFDTRVREMALVREPGKENKFIQKSSIGMLLFGLALTAVFIVIMVILFNTSVHSFRLPIIFVLGPIILAVGIYSIIKDMFTYNKRKALLEKELLASRKRCQNENYTNAIKAQLNSFANTNGK